MRRLTMLLVLAVVPAIAIAGCGGGDTAEEADTTVELAIDPVLEGDVLKIAGTSNLPDGAFVTYEVTDSLWGAASGSGEAGEPTDQRYDGIILVNGGTFGAAVDIVGFSPGEIKVRVAFQTTGPDLQQPDEIIELYGEMGEKMTGDVVTSDGLTRVETTATLEK